MKRIPLTSEGAKRLREELNHLKKVVRPDIIRAIADARAHGDLKENAEYHAAREQQSFTEGRIRTLESSLSHAQIIEVSKLDAGDRVVFGGTVTLADEEKGEEKVFQIVGELESDLVNSRVSVNSPMARALIGKEIGDVVEVQAPGGVREYEIVHVEYR